MKKWNAILAKTEKKLSIIKITRGRWMKKIKILGLKYYSYR
jgi:hypothetical protein